LKHFYFIFFYLKNIIKPSCCATSGDICTQLYELESTNGVPKSIETALLNPLHSVNTDLIG